MGRRNVPEPDADRLVGMVQDISLPGRRRNATSDPRDGTASSSRRMGSRFRRLAGDGLALAKAGPLLVLERLRLVPPTLEGEVAGRIGSKFPSGAPDATTEGFEVEVQDVLEAFDAGLDHQLVFIGPE